MVAVGHSFDIVTGSASSNFSPLGTELRLSSYQLPDQKSEAGQSATVTGHRVVTGVAGASAFRRRVGSRTGAARKPALARTLDFGEGGHSSPIRDDRDQPGPGIQALVPGPAVGAIVRRGSKGGRRSVTMLLLPSCAPSWHGILHGIGWWIIFKLLFHKNFSPY